VPAVNWLFDSGEATTKPLDAICWWELRRIPYNLIVGVVLFASVALMEVLGDLSPPPAKPFVEPSELIPWVLLFAGLANLAYTLGWVLERRVSDTDPVMHQVFRAQNFRRGLFWSCVMASAPVWLSIVALLVGIITQ